jgi:hypothetical protein
MRQLGDESRRWILKALTFGIALMPIAAIPMRVARAAEAPSVSPDDPTAKALKYANDASKARDAMPGSSCANCALYQGAAGSARGDCPLFPGKTVTATGWCSAWNRRPSE